MSETISGTFTLSFTTPGVTPTLAITTIPGSVGPGAQVTVQGAFAGAAPSGVTGIWNPGNINAAPTGFSVSGLTWTATFTAPGPLGTYTLTVTGTGANQTSTTSTQVVVIQPSTLVISTIPATADTNSTVLVTGSYSGGVPTGITAVWNPGVVVPIVTNFTISLINQTWQANVPTPSAANTYTLTVTGLGPNTTQSAASTGVVISAAGGTNPIGLISHTFIAGSAAGGTSPAIDTTGASLLVIHLSDYSAAGAGVVSDSKGNTWVKDVESSQGASRSAIFHAANPAVGSGHTFTIVASNSGAEVLAFSNVATASPLDLTHGAGSGGGIVAPGAVAPNFNGSLIVTGTAEYTGLSFSIDKGFTTTDTDSFVAAAQTMASCAAYLVQTNAASVLPTWTSTAVYGGANPAYGELAGTIAVFTSANPGGGGGINNTFAINPLPASISVGKTLIITGTFAGSTPSNITAVWNSGAISGSPTGFAVVGNTWSATVTAPGSAASYALTITGTGANTATATSTTIAVQIEAFAIVSPPSAGTESATLTFSGTYAGGIPSGATYSWSGGGGTGTMSAFSASAGTWTGGVVAPISAATFTLTATATGPNTSVAVAGSGTVITAAVPVLVHSFSLTNWNASGTSPGFMRLGIAFKKGDVLNGSALQIKISSTVKDAQFDARTTWTDGSLKFVVCHLRDTAFSASEVRTYNIWTLPASSFNNTGSLTLASITAAHNFSVAFTGLNQNDGNTTTTVGSGAFAASFNTQMAVATRIEKYHSGAVCEGWMGWGMATDNSGGAPDAHLKTIWYADIWKNSDGSINAVEVGAVVAQDWFNGQTFGGMRRSYNAALKDGNTTLVSYANVDHPYRCQWITCLNDGSNNRGRRMWVGGAMPTLLYQPNLTYWINSKLVPPWDLGIIYGPGYSGPTNTTYIPCTNQDHRPGIDSTGGYAGRGLLGNPDAMMFVRQTAPDAAAGRINGHVGLGVFYHYRSRANRTRPTESADIANTPLSLVLATTDGSAPPYDFTADGMPAPFGGDGSAYLYGQVPPGGSGVWSNGTADPSHAVNYSGGIYLLEGERYHLEACLDLAMNTVHQNATYWDAMTLLGKYRNDTGGSPMTDAYSEAYFGHPVTSNLFNGIGGLSYQRTTGWSMNLSGFAAAMTPDNHVAKRSMQRFFLQQALYLGACLAACPPDVAAAGLSLDEQTTGEDAPWMDAIVAMGCIHAGNLNESAPALAYGFMKANMSVNLVTKGCYRTTALDVHNLQLHSPIAAAGNTFGFPVNAATTNPKPAHDIFGDIDPVTNTITFYYPQDQNTNQFQYPHGMYPNVGDSVFLFIPITFTVTPSGNDLVDGTEYFIIDVATVTATVEGRAYTARRCHISLTSGGSPMTFTTPATNVPFDTNLISYDALTVPSDPPFLPQADDYPPMHLAVLVIANMAGYAPASTALMNKQATFMAPVDRRGWPAMTFNHP